MATSMRQKVLTGLVVVVVAGLVVAVVAGRDSPTHRVLTAALHKHGCQEAAVVEQVQDAPKAWTGFRHKVDTSWRVDGCGASYDAVIREEREPTGRRGKHHRDVYEVVFWQPHST